MPETQNPVQEPTSLGAGMMGIMVLPLVERFGRPWPRPDIPPAPKRRNPRRAAQAAQRKARAITRRAGK